MKNQEILACLCFFSMVAVSCSSASQDNIKKINTRVTSIEDSLKKGEYTYFEISEQTVSEGSPPNLKFYYQGNRLVVVIISVGHETWSNEFRYYFLTDGKLMKYVKTSDRPDNPPKEAIIYDEKGEIIWKNTETSPFKAGDLLYLFKKIQEAKGSFSKY